MLINATHEDAGVRTSCSCVMFENYDVSNLASADPQTRLRGFRAERFIRGPITVKINFEELAKKTRYTIEAVIFRGALRDNSSMVVDVFAEDYRCEKFLGRCDLIGSVTAISNSISVLMRQYNSSLKQLASKVKASYISVALKDSLKPTPQVTHMHNSSFLLQTQIKYLSFKISRVKGGISAGFKWLEIWLNCDQSPYLEIPDNLPCICYSADMLFDYEIENNIIIDDTNSAMKKLPVNIDIPSEFIDSLTFELMVDPVALPSGKYMDMQSVNKLYKYDEEEDIILIDPFTGLKLATDYKPVVDVLLRDRIKAFVTSSHSNPNKVSTSNSASRNSLTLSNTLEISTDNGSDLTYSELGINQIRQNSPIYSNTVEISTDYTSDLSNSELNPLNHIRQKRLNYFDSDYNIESKRLKVGYSNQFYRKPKEMLNSTILPFQSDPKTPIDHIDLTDIQSETTCQNTPQIDIIELD